MLRKMRELAGNYPLLCLGDFNSTPDSEPITIMSAGLTDAYRVSAIAPYGPVGTFNDFKLDAELKDRIDYIFINSRVKVQKYAALTDSYSARFPSDHLPVVARVTLN
jgi:endonuclease/exonuclease/phosphatase family metal-dependent hydrolase